MEQLGHAVGTSSDESVGGTSSDGYFSGSLGESVRPYCDGGRLPMEQRGSEQSDSGSDGGHLESDADSEGFPGGNRYQRPVLARGRRWPPDDATLGQPTGN